MKGGLEQMFINYALVLSKKYIVICIVPEDFKYFNELKSNNLSFEIIKIRNFYDISAAAHFIRLHKKYKPKFIFSHNGRFNSVTKISCLLSKLKNTVAICHGDTKRLSSFSRVLTVNSTLEKNLLRKNIKNVNLLPNFIEVKETKKQRKNLDKSVFTFGVISRLSPEKCVLNAIRAIELLPQSNNTQYRLKIAGTGPELDMLYSYVEKHSLQDIVIFSGWVSDKNEFYSSIDCFILTSLYEPFGLTILEAFNYSLPVISSRTDGPNEIIEDGINGLLYEPNNIKQLITLMTQVYSTPSLTAKIGARGFSTLHNKYSKKAFEKNLFHLLSQTK